MVKILLQTLVCRKRETTNAIPAPHVEPRANGAENAFYRGFTFSLLVVIAVCLSACAVSPVAIVGSGNVVQGSLVVTNAPRHYLGDGARIDLRIVSGDEAVRGVFAEKLDLYFTNYDVGLVSADPGTTNATNSALHVTELEFDLSSAQKEDATIRVGMESDLKKLERDLSEWEREWRLRERQRASLEGEREWAQVESSSGGGYWKDAYAHWFDERMMAGVLGVSPKYIYIKDDAQFLRELESMRELAALRRGSLSEYVPEMQEEKRGTAVCRMEAFDQSGRRVFEREYRAPLTKFPQEYTSAMQIEVLSSRMAMKIREDYCFTQEDAQLDLIAWNRMAREQVEVPDVAKIRALEESGENRVSYLLLLGYGLHRAGELDEADAVYREALQLLEAGSSNDSSRSVETAVMVRAAARLLDADRSARELMPE